MDIESLKLLRCFCLILLYFGVGAGLYGGVWVFYECFALVAFVLTLCCVWKALTLVLGFKSGCVMLFGVYAG